MQLYGFVGPSVKPEAHGEPRDAEEVVRPRLALRSLLAPVAVLSAIVRLYATSRFSMQLGIDRWNDGDFAPLCVYLVGVRVFLSPPSGPRLR